MTRGLACDSGRDALDLLSVFDGATLTSVLAWAGTPVHVHR